MEGSGQHACPMEHVDLDRLSGSSDRVYAQNEENPRRDCVDKDMPKCTVLFKSPTYISNADDSGFVELCPPPEADDDAWPMRRENFLQNPNITPFVCSTPNMGTFPETSFTRFDTTNSSPIHGKLFQVCPLDLSSYFIAQSDSQNLNIDHPKIIFNTVFDRTVSGQITKAGSQDHLSKRSLGDNADSVLKKEATTAQKQTSDFTRGHSTIASLLNSRPLHLVNTEQKNEETNSVKCVTASSSFIRSDTNGSKIATSVCDITGDGDRKAETSSLSIIDEDIKTTCGDSKEAFDPSISNVEHEYTLEDIYQDTGGVDENNNDFRLVQKYSDISDTCASDTETSIETSSSEAEQPEVKEVSVKPAERLKTRRKSKHPCRSAAKEDPRFKGVTVWLQTTFRNGHSRLHISAIYSNVKEVSLSRRSLAYQGRCSTPHCLGFSDQDDSSPLHCQKDSHVTVKTCASCKTRRTPLWRDAEDGTPLCNACGIRYKKYRLRCSKCWHIPKKEVKTYPNCPVCGASLRFSLHKKTW